MAKLRAFFKIWAELSNRLFANITELYIGGVKQPELGGNEQIRRLAAEKLR